MRSTLDAASLAAPSEAEARVGELLLGKLRVVSVLGEGGMGVVYEVVHQVTKHHRALKVLHRRYADDADVVARFLREASVAGTLGTPSVVETFDAGQLEDGSPYVLMELLEGETLARAMERGAPPARFVAWLIEACEGVAAAHDAGIVHRDLKPENLFVAKTREGERVKVLDFGVSKFARREEERRLTETGRVIGTPMYMSPEQVGGSPDLDARTDVYSLGVILYEALAGKPPFYAEALPTLAVRIHLGEHEPLSRAAPSLDPALAKIVERALARDPDDRFQTVRELAAALAPFASASVPIGLAATLPSAPPPALPSRPRRRGLAVIAVAAGLLLIALAVAWGTAEPAREAAPAAPAPARPATPAPVIPEPSLAEGADLPAPSPEPEPAPAPPRRERARPPALPDIDRTDPFRP